MKKSFLLLGFILVVLNLFAQTATNADGSLKFRGNVAILVNGNSFTFENGEFKKSVKDETFTLLETAIRALSIQKFQDMNFGVVNRDDEATKQVQQLIEENKLEDYLDGFSVNAKGQGADFLFLVDLTLYGENNNAAQMEIATRLISIQSNFGYHYVYKSDAMALNNMISIQNSVKNMVDDFTAFLENMLLEVFPEQYFVTRTNGKTWNLGAYQPNGRILTTDKFYAFRFKKENVTIAQQNLPLQVLEEVAVGESPSQASDGTMQLKMNKSVDNISDIVVFRNLNEPMFMGTNQMFYTFFGLDYDSNSYDGLNKKRINNAVFAAITRHPGTQLIEHDHLPEIKKERELQKSEEFIDGHVVEQMKAIGAQYLIKLEDYAYQENQVSFKMSFISVAENKIIRIIDVTSSIDNLENEMYKQLCERIAYPCLLKKTGKDKIEMFTMISLPSGTKCTLEANKEIKNPMTEEISYTRVNLCSVRVDEYQGNKSIVSVEDVFSQGDMDEIENLSENGKVFLMVDGSDIQSDTDTKSDVKKKSERISKRKSFLNTLKKAVEGVEIKIQ